MAKQVRSLLNIEDISLDPRIGIAMQFAAKDRKDIVLKKIVYLGSWKTKVYSDSVERSQF